MRRCVFYFFVLFVCQPLLALAAPIDHASITGLDLPALQQKMTIRYGKKIPKLWGEHLPGIVTEVPLYTQGKGIPPKTMALTLDVCGGGKDAVDKKILSLLQEQNIPATLFITSSWLHSNSDMAKALAANPLFEIAAHGERHKPASVSGRSAYGIKGTDSVAALVEEVEGNVREIETLTGKRPKWYRSGTAYYDDVAVTIVGELGLHIAGYSVTLDAGATLPAGQVSRRALTAPDRAILLAHLNRPKSGTGSGLATALPTLKATGVRFVRLSDLPMPQPAERK